MNIMAIMEIMELMCLLPVLPGVPVVHYYVDTKHCQDTGTIVLYTLPKQCTDCQLAATRRPMGGQGWLQWRHWRDAWPCWPPIGQTVATLSRQWPWALWCKSGLVWSVLVSNTASQPWTSASLNRFHTQPPGLSSLSWINNYGCLTIFNWLVWSVLVSTTALLPWPSASLNRFHTQPPGSSSLGT